MACSSIVVIVNGAYLLMNRRTDQMEAVLICSQSHGKLYYESVYSRISLAIDSRARVSDAIKQDPAFGNGLKSSAGN